MKKYLNILTILHLTRESRGGLRGGTRDVTLPVSDQGPTGLGVTLRQVPVGPGTVKPSLTVDVPVTFSGRGLSFLLHPP